MRDGRAQPRTAVRHHRRDRTRVPHATASVFVSPLSNTAGCRCIYMLHTETTNKRGADLNNVSSNSVRSGRGATFLPLFYCQSNPPRTRDFSYLQPRLRFDIFSSNLLQRTRRTSSEIVSINFIVIRANSGTSSSSKYILEFIVACVPINEFTKKSSVSRKIEHQHLKSIEASRNYRLLREAQSIIINVSMYKTNLHSTASFP